jgi:hypothetical protein
MAIVESLTDTDPEAARVQMDLLRRASPARRLRLALSLSESVLSLSRAGIARLVAAAALEHNLDEARPLAPGLPERGDAAAGLDATTLAIADGMVDAAGLAQVPADERAVAFERGWLGERLMLGSVVRPVEREPDDAAGASVEPAERVGLLVEEDPHPFSEARLTGAGPGAVVDEQPRRFEDRCERLAAMEQAHLFESLFQAHATSRGGSA